MGIALFDLHRCALRSVFIVLWSIRTVNSPRFTRSSGRRNTENTRRTVFSQSDYNRPVYSAELLDHFQNPRNVGAIESPDASAQIENPACGDVLKLTLKIEANRIADIRFRAKGCVPSMACGSAITELVKGRTMQEARQLSREDVVRKVGGLPAASRHASQLAIETLNEALKKIRD